MSYPYQGRSGSFSPRRRQPQSRGRFSQVSTVDPSKYVNKAVEQETQEVYVSQHTFDEFNLDPKLIQNVRTHGYDVPTPIQDQTIPSLMEGRDVVGIANTGTGKTAAFLLPLLHKIILDPQQGALILAPTRELALQIQEELLAFSNGLKIGVCLCIGGASLDKQVQRLRTNPHFVIGTPGRIKDLINRGAFDTRMFTNIVLDEVDRMLDIGFVKDIKFLISKLPEVRQSAFFSATINRETEDIMRSLLRDPVQVTVKSKVTSNHIHQEVVRVAPGGNKIDVLHELLKQPEFKKVIVFGRTKHGINKLEEILVSRGVRVSSIHGNKTQGARQRSLQDIKGGYVQVLLATDVAARGIDIENVTHVINYDEPQTYEDYIHRIGRTGRAGKLGKALTFLSR
ncbi:MAG: DEAD/DEAH box helicase [Patescibacteria group bacterium]